MYQKLNLLLLSSFLIFISCQKESIKSTNKPLDSSYYEFFKLGASDSLFFINPRFIEIDLERNIYIADEGLMKIVKLDSLGNYIKDIGERGRGPAQISSIRGFYLDNDIILFDRILGRINVFDLNGIFKKSYPSKEIPNMIHIEKKNDGGYLLFYLENPMNYSKSQILHSYDSLFNYQESYFEITEFITGKEKFIGPLLSTSIGDIEMNALGKIVYTPNLNKGEVFHLNMVQSGSDYTGKITEIGKGLSFMDPYQIRKESNNRQPDLSITFAGDNKPQEVLINNHTNGLFSLKNGDLVQFATIYNDTRKFFGFNKYNSDWAYLGFFQVFDLPHNEPFKWEVKAVDKFNRFYIVDRSRVIKDEGEIIIRVVSFEGID